MSIYKINKESDIKLLVNITDENNEIVSPTKYPFILKYYTFYDPKKVIECSYDGTTFTNCKQAGNNIEVNMNSPMFKQGKLLRHTTIKVLDNSFPDGYYNRIFIDDTGIYIVE